MEFKPKHDIGVDLFLFVLVPITGTIFLIAYQDIISGLGLLAIFITAIIMAQTTEYIIRGNVLYLESKFRKFSIDIRDIQELREKKSLKMHMSFSVRCIEISSKNYKVCISPKDKRRFIEEIQKINNQVVINQ